MTERQAQRYGLCGWCGGPIPPERRAHAACRVSACRVSACRARNRAATAVESVSGGILAVVADPVVAENGWRGVRPA